MRIHRIGRDVSVRDDQLPVPGDARDGIEILRATLVTVGGQAAVCPAPRARRGRSDRSLTWPVSAKSP